jgi:hypothetical protein
LVHCAENAERWTGWLPQKCHFSQFFEKISDFLINSFKINDLEDKNVPFPEQLLSSHRHLTLGRELR